MHLDEVGFEVFNDQLNTEFRVRATGGDLVPFVLVRASRGPTSAQFEQFSAFLEAPAASPLPQGTYPFEHDVLGSFDLFVVPIGQNADVRTYEAVFSRRIPTPTATNQEAARE